MKVINVVSLVLFLLLIASCDQNASGQRKNEAKIIESSDRKPKFPLKEQTELFTRQEIHKLRENISTYPKAQQVRDIFVNAANNFLQWKDEELISLIPDGRTPRAFDLSTVGCPIHGDAVFSRAPKDSTVWAFDPKRPFKVICRIGHEVYPSNEYLSLIERQDEGTSDVKGDYYDDGWGWADTKGNRYWFVAHANYLTLRYFVHPAILNLSRAYLLTGDKRYAHKASVMLYRIAQVYPSMNQASQSRYGIMSRASNIEVKGRVFDSIQETFFIQDMAEAYDLIWEAIDEDNELQNTTKKTGEEIRSTIESNLLEEAIDAYSNGDIRGNYGMHQYALLNVIFSRQYKNRNDLIEQILNNPTDDRYFTGLKYGLYNNVFRDGLPFESPNYNSHWVERYSQISNFLNKRRMDPFSSKRLKLLYDAPIELVAIGKYTVDVGDSGSPVGGITGRNADVYQSIYGKFKEKKYLDWLAAIGVNLTGERTFSSFNSLFLDPLPKSTPLPEGRVVSPQPSRLFAGYGLGILNNKADRTAISLNYGLHVTHFHWDFLNIELFANGQKMMPDLGYPDAMNVYVPEVYSWSTNTVAHNTVVVDAERQNQNLPGTLHNFIDSDFARTIDASSSAYSQTDLYRRNVLMVDIDNENSYFVDVFRVKGGTQHDYSLHGPPGSFEIIKGKFSKKQNGTLAGNNVEVGRMYDDKVLSQKDYNKGYQHYKGSGYQHLFNVQKLVEGTPVFEFEHANDKNSRLKVHLLKDNQSEVFISDAFDKPKAKTNLLKYIIARRTAKSNEEPFESTFISVLEPFREEGTITGLKRIDNQDSGNVILKIGRNNNFDIIISDVTNSIKTIKDFDLETDAKYAVVSFNQQGELKRLFFSDGTYLKHLDKVYNAQEVTGIVEDMDIPNNKLTIKVEKKLSLSELGKRNIFHITNPYRQTVHPIAQAYISGNKLILTTQDDILIGLVKIDKASGPLLSTSMYLPFRQSYVGASILDEQYRNLGTIKNMKKGVMDVLYRNNSGKTIRKGDNIWISNIGIGDKITIPAVFSLVN